MTYEESEDVTPWDSARKVLDDLHVPGLLKAETVNGISVEWDVKGV